MPLDTPEAVIARYVELMNGGDVDGALALFEEDACYVGEGGAIHGRAAIRERLEAFAASGLQLAAEVEQTYATGDLVLLIDRYRIFGTGPGGEEVDARGVGTNVFRKQSDGGWLCSIDVPGPPE